MTDEEIKEYWRTAYCNEKYKKEELEKENEELKAENEELKAENGAKKYAEFYFETNNQLTKAIELLKKFVRLENYTLDYDDIKEAEQFLSEMKNEN